MRVLIAFLALCGIATANHLNANCNDTAAQQFAAGLLQAGCNSLTDCTAECVGALCQFFTNNNYTEDCIITMAFNCLRQVRSVPAQCDRCLDTLVISTIPTLPSSCGFLDGSSNDMKLCVDDCFGQSCQFYSDNSYPSSCPGGLEQICLKAGISVPSTCAGHVAQPTPSPESTPSIRPTPSPGPTDDFFGCSDQAQMEFSMASLTGCNMSNFCTSKCGGALCTYHTDNDYPATCNIGVAGRCFFDIADFPSTCNTCFDTGVVRHFLSLPRSCDFVVDRDPRVLCTDECIGAMCKYYKENDFDDTCRTDIGKSCMQFGVAVPISCGAVAMKTILSVLAMIPFVSLSLVF